MNGSELYTNKIIILDFGSQYTQLIARKIREAGVYSEILPPVTPLSSILHPATKGVVFSGGPASVFQKNAPVYDKKIFSSGIPVLGICYGMQLMAHLLGGKVIRADRREYGLAEITIERECELFEDVSRNGRLNVWMSHWDQVIKEPKGFKIFAASENTKIVAMADPARRFYGLQFHPEVHHTEAGHEILKNFLFKICGCKPTWSLKSFVESAVERVRETVGRNRVLCALSGGVDSAVTAVIVHRAVGDHLRCIFVNNGLLREGEAETIMDLFRKKLLLPLTYVNASRRFLSRLSGVVDPERKRKIIGNEFIRIFEGIVEKKQKDTLYLAQGTLYPDVIESTSFKGPSAKIKTHHNVGGLPKRFRFRLIEPLRELFKDEVREIGTAMGIPREVISRHPFPGPGLAVRIIGDVTKDRLRILRKVDKIVEDELRASDNYDKLWQGFAVLLPVRSVGVMGDQRTYANVIALRCVNSMDGMTANWAKLPPDLLERISGRIVNEVMGVNRVVYDISNKPPSTIEWE